MRTREKCGEARSAAPERRDRWDSARVYVDDRSDRERSRILNGNHSPAIVAIGSYPRMHSKLFNTVVLMEEIIKIRLCALSLAKIIETSTRY